MQVVPIVAGGHQSVFLPIRFYMLQGVLGRLLREPLPVGAGELVMEPSFGHIHHVHVQLGLGQSIAVLLGRGVLRGLGRRFRSGLRRGCGLPGGGHLRHPRLDRPFRSRDGGPLGGLDGGGRGLAALGTVVEGEGQDNEAGQGDLHGCLQPPRAPDGDDGHDGQEEYPQQHPAEGDLLFGLFWWQRLAVRPFRVRPCAAVGTEVPLEFRAAAGAPVHEYLPAAGWAKYVVLLVLGPAVFTDLHFFFLRN